MTVRISAARALVALAGVAWCAPPPAPRCPTRSPAARCATVHVDRRKAGVSARRRRSTAWSRSRPASRCRGRRPRHHRAPDGLGRTSTSGWRQCQPRTACASNRTRAAARGAAASCSPGDIGTARADLRDRRRRRFGATPAAAGPPTSPARSGRAPTATTATSARRCEPRPLDDAGSAPGDLVFDVPAGRGAPWRTVSDVRGTPAEAVRPCEARCRSRAGDAYEPSAARQPPRCRGRASGRAATRGAGHLTPRVDETAHAVDLAHHRDPRPARRACRLHGDPLPDGEAAAELVPVAREARPTRTCSRTRSCASSELPAGAGLPRRATRPTTQSKRRPVPSTSCTR